MLVHSDSVIPGTCLFMKFCHSAVSDSELGVSGVGGGSICTLYLQKSSLKEESTH